MIKGLWRETEGGIELSLHGHAKREKEGTDYACSKVSVLSQALAYGVLEFFYQDSHGGSYYYNSSHGDFKLSVKFGSMAEVEKRELMAMFSVALYGLDIVAMQYENSIVIASESVKEKC